MKAGRGQIELEWYEWALLGAWFAGGARVFGIALCVLALGQVASMVLAKYWTFTKRQGGEI